MWQPLAWFVDFAVLMVNRYEAGRDGQTLCWLRREKQSRLIGFDFGENVNFRRTAVAARMAMLDSVWNDSVLLVHLPVSGEIVVGTVDGVLETRTVQHKVCEHHCRKNR